MGGGDAAEATGGWGMGEDATADTGGEASWETGGGEASW